MWVSVSWGGGIFLPLGVGGACVRLRGEGWGSDKHGLVCAWSVHDIYVLNCNSGLLSCVRLQ